MLVFVSFAKIGSILSAYGDLDADTDLDASFDPCSTADLPDEMTNELIVGLNSGMLSLTVAIGSASSDLTSTSDIYSQTCDDLESFNPALNFCSKMTLSDVTSNDRKGMRTLINDGNNIGLGSCVGAAIGDCLCL